MTRKQNRPTNPPFNRLHTVLGTWSARELKTMFATGGHRITWVITKITESRRALNVEHYRAVPLAVDRGRIVNISRHLNALLGLKFDPYAYREALILGTEHPVKVTERLSMMLYLDGEKLKAEVV